MNTLYYSFIKPEKIDNISVKNLERLKYITSISDLSRRNQSFAVWKLLEYATIRLFGAEFNYCVINGVWKEKNNAFNFSLSHSDKMVAVLISKDEEVGVDCEILSDKLLKLDKFFSLNLEEFSLDEKKRFLAKLWAKNESNIKSKQKLKGYYRFIKNQKDEYVVHASSSSPVKFIKVDFNKVLKETL